MGSVQYVLVLMSVAALAVLGANYVGSPADAVQSPARQAPETAQHPPGCPMLQEQAPAEAPPECQEADETAVRKMPEDCHAAPQARRGCRKMSGCMPTSGCGGCGSKAKAVPQKESCH